MSNARCSSLGSKMPCSVSAAATLTATERDGALADLESLNHSNWQHGSVRNDLGLEIRTLPGQACEVESRADVLDSAGGELLCSRIAVVDERVLIGPGQSIDPGVSS